jgi:hypothetical protein
MWWQDEPIFDFVQQGQPLHLGQFVGLVDFRVRSDGLCVCVWGT